MRVPFWLRHPIRSVRMRLTPSCTACANSQCIAMRICCKCPEYREHFERVNCSIPIAVNARAVRGSRYCRFSPREDK